MAQVDLTGVVPEEEVPEVLEKLKQELMELTQLAH